MRRRRGEDSDSDEIAELAALADGSLAAERRAALEASVAASPELAERLAEQERAVELTRLAAAGVGAPVRLRAQVEAGRRATRTAPPRNVLRLGAAAGLAAASVAAVVVGLAVFGSGTTGERLHVALAPTALAPGAGGEATLTKSSSGWRIEVDATGLPRLDGGRFYQAWLRDPAGVLVPVGTFNEGRKLTLWAGVSPKRFTTLTVTRERADGEQGSSGEKVLVGVVASGDSH